MTRTNCLLALRRRLTGLSRFPIAHARRCALRCEALEDRSVPAVLSSFLTSEHVDLEIGYTGGAAGTWSLGPHDQDNEVVYAADEALLYAGTPAQTARPTSAAFDFIGVGPGASFYQLPQSQNPDLLYLGVRGSVTATDFDRYNPSVESKGRVSGLGRWIKVTLVDVEHTTPSGQPGSGQFSVWQSEADGPNVFMSSFNDNVSNSNGNGLDTTDGISADDALWIVAGGHSHFNYGFTEPGRYAVTFKLSGYQDDGNTTSLGNFVQSENITVYFSVASVGQVEFDSAAYTVNESAGTATVTVHRTGGSDGRITVNYATANGTATAGSDYTATSGTLTFNDGETQKTFTVPITDDTDTESDETINLTLSAPGPASINGYLINVQNDANGLLGTQSSAVLTITANDSVGPNTPPTIEDALDQSTNEDTPKTVNFTIGDAETAPSALTVTASSSDTALVPNANLVLDGSGANRTVTITPAANLFGTTTITLTVTDTGGAMATDTFVLTVNAVNDVPTANPQSVSTDEDSPKLITLTGSDVENDPLTFTVTSGPAHGTLTGTGANRTYTPDPDYNGPDSFTFIVNDGTTDSAEATVSITVTTVPAAPLAVADAYTVSAGNTVRANVLLNDSDAGSDPISAELVSDVTAGALTLNPDGTFTYTPGANFAGTDSFRYRTSDGALFSDPVTVTITAAGFQNLQAILTTQHTDIGLAYEDDEWDLHVHNEDDDVEYAPNEVLLYVDPQALTPRTGGLADSAFDFLGVGAGASFYRLPEAQNPELLYLGFGAEEIEDGTFLGDAVTVRLKAVNGPGQFSVWRSTDLGPVVLMATSDGITSADTATVLAGGDAHINFGFTARGRYEVTFEAIATLPDGSTTSSGNVTYYFSVDNLGQVQLSSATYSVAEGGTVTVTVTRTGGTDGPLAVDYATSNGTATAGTDYTAASGTLMFNDGEAQKTFTVVTRTDSLAEGPETVNLTLTAPTGPALGIPTTAVLTITDRPALPVPPPGSPAAPTPKPALGGAVVFSNFLFLLDSAGQVTAAFPVPTGTVAVFTDVTGDQNGDAVVFFPTSTLVMNGFTGQVQALATDIDGDRIPELFLFSPDGAIQSVAIGRTGQTIALI